MSEQGTDRIFKSQLNSRCYQLLSCIEIRDPDQMPTKWR